MGPTHSFSGKYDSYATYKISRFLLVSAAEQAGLSLNWSETLETDFLATRPISYTWLWMTTPIPAILLQKYNNLHHVHTLTLCILMDFPIHFDTISMGVPIVYFKRSHVEFS